MGYRLAYQRWATAVLNGSEFVRFCGPGEVGVVLLHGPNVFAGYTDGFHNRNVSVQINGERWLNTGDLGRLDAEGLPLAYRAGEGGDHRGGHNIDPRMIEEPLMRHPAVALSAAVGRPDARLGEVPVVYVELKPGANPTPDELMAFAQEEIGERAALPKEVRILDAIPLTAVGKIYKPALYHEQVEDALRSEVKKVAGVISLTVNADMDKRLGTVVHVDVTTRSGVEPEEMAATLRGILGQYPARLPDIGGWRSDEMNEEYGMGNGEQNQSSPPFPFPRPCGRNLTSRQNRLYNQCKRLHNPSIDNTQPTSTYKKWFALCVPKHAGRPKFLTTGIARKFLTVNKVVTVSTIRDVAVPAVFTPAR